INQDALAQSFGDHFERSRSYGLAMYTLLPMLQQGVSWQTAAKMLFSGQGSFGNGAVMRVAPLGAYFADDLEAVVENARLSAEVTHAHPEAIAVATAWAWRLRGVPMTRAEFLDRILPFVPEGEVRSGCTQARDIRHGNSLRNVVAMLGNGSGISC